MCFQHCVFYPIPDQNQENFEEHFEVSSMGEMWQELDMAQQEDQEIQEMSQSASGQTHLFNIAVCINLASIVVFL